MNTQAAGIFKEAAVTQSRVIGALILREMRVRYGHSRVGYIWAIVEPMVWIMAISVMFSVTGAHPLHGDNMGLFVALGITPFFLFRNLGTQLGAAFDANQALLNFPIVKEIDTVIARAILEFATSLVIMFLLVSGNILFMGAALPNNLLEMLIAFLAIGLFGFGIGLGNAVLSTRLNSWKNIYVLIQTPLFWISGVFFSLESLPVNIRKILIWNPIIHGAEAMRDGYFTNYRNSHIDLQYLLLCGLLVVIISLAAERAIRIRRS